MSFAAESRERARPVLPLAAMVDILFLLLVFFITASTFKSIEPAIQIQLTPLETSQATAAPTAVTIITITADNQLFIGDRSFDLPGVENYLQTLYQASPNEPIFIRADETADIGVYQRLLDFARLAGFDQIQMNGSGAATPATTTTATTPATTTP